MKMSGFIKVLSIMSASLFCMTTHADEAVVQIDAAAEVAGQCSATSQPTKKNMQMNAKGNSAPKYGMDGREHSRGERMRRLSAADYEAYSLKQKNFDARGREITTTTKKK